MREEQPLDLILLFDISRSMRGAVQRVAAAAEAGLGELRRGDRVSLRVFNTESRIVLPFTADLVRARSAVQSVASMSFGGGTFIQSAIDEVAKSFDLEQSSSRRRAILIITDNTGVRTRREETVVEDLWRADTILSGLIIRDPAFQAAHTISKVINPAGMLVEAGMAGIADKTGGDVIQDKDAEAGLRQAIHRIRMRYSIYYRMPPDAGAGERRRIRVELTPDASRRVPGAQITARAGYVVPARTAQ